jgi:uncharacterized protein YabE (DUF348 family)/3D (Asp-Asp-Asp) domain-containing protein
MKSLRWLAFFLLLFLFACQPNSLQSITIIDGETILNISSSARTPLLILTEAGITPQPADRVFVNGIPSALDEAISASSVTQLQLRRAVAISVITPDGEQIIQTSALTVGQALSEADFSLGVNDIIDPPAETAILNTMTVNYSPARDLVITAGADVINIRSAAGMVGAALAEAGIPLIGLDTSHPLENEAPPDNGQIRITRVYESINITMEPIPFEEEFVDSLDVTFGDEKILQPGVNGITMVRTRIRYEDGNEVNRETEDKTILREPQKQIVASGTKIVMVPAGGEIPYEYWYATEMYASWYSPCNSGTGNCSYGTASGARAGFGIVAVDYSIYPSLAGMKVFIPGYGVATIGDTGGGPIIETAFGVPRTKWIDLGYDDNAIGGLSGWVTVYFLAPAPTEIPYFLK